MDNECIILIGNIGAGKSTHVRKLVGEGYRIVSKDAIRYMLGGGEYIFDEKLEEVVHKVAIDTLKYLLDKGYSIAIDETNMSKEKRQEYLNHVIHFRYVRTALLLPKISKEESVRRRLGSNHGDTSKEVWEDVWEIKNNEYEEPTYDEGFHNIIRLLKE